MRLFVWRARKPARRSRAASPQDVFQRFVRTLEMLRPVARGGALPRAAITRDKP